SRWSQASAQNTHTQRQTNAKQRPCNRGLTNAHGTSLRHKSTNKSDTQARHRTSLRSPSGPSFSFFRFTATDLLDLGFFPTCDGGRGRAQLISVVSVARAP
ncbi:hypothetical protein M758_2G037500, partial [Ceratodon purpureus]